MENMMEGIMKSLEDSIARRSLIQGAVAAAGLAAGAAVVSSAGLSAAFAEEPVEGETVRLHRGYAAPHGDRSFAQIVVALDEAGTIVAANVDEYQFMGVDAEGIVPVPNSEGMGDNFVEGVVLFSKRDNNEAYSAIMAAKSGAAQTWDENMSAVEEFARGKTPAELEGVDAVAGCTLSDCLGYLGAIALVAQDDTLVAEGRGMLEGAMFGRVNYAAHGSKAFANAVTLVGGGAIVAASIDEFQCMSAEMEGLVPVPSSDGTFGENIVEGVELASKRVNDEPYSARIVEKAGATQTWGTSMKAIEASLVGHHVDAISGATLVDARHYAIAAIKGGLNA